MDTVKKSEVMQKQWKNYQKDFEYHVRELCGCHEGLRPMFCA